MCSTELRRQCGRSGRGDSLLWGESGPVMEEAAVTVEPQRRKVSCHLRKMVRKMAVLTRSSHRKAVVPGRSEDPVVISIFIQS